MGISYAFWQLTKIQEDSNIIASGCFGVSLEGNEAINLANAYPMTIEDGMSTTPYTFTITNTCGGEANYIVNLESLSNTTFTNSSIRVALDDTNKLYSEYEESSKYYSDSVEARTLISGTLESNGSVTYNLRMWIDEAAPTTEQNKIFASKIVVTSGQQGDFSEEPIIENLIATSTFNTISITYNTNGDRVPATCKWGIEAGTYDNEVADATSTECNITGLNENTTYYYQICTETGKGNKCIEGDISTQKNILPLAEQVEIGDYISMTPTSTGYIISKETTGYSSLQAIDPSELNLWRVIKKNDDGTVEMVSEYISSEKVYFRGTTGYLNLVGGLNTIAAQYTNEKYVQSTRHMGYRNQTELCPSLSSSSCPSDNGYSTDTNLVQTAIGTLVGKTPSGTSTSYWLASRYITIESATYYNGRLIDTGGSADRVYIERQDAGSFNRKSGVRPIVTLKSTVEISSGDGQSAETAYQLS